MYVPLDFSRRVTRVGETERSASPMNQSDVIEECVERDGFGLRVGQAAFLDVRLKGGEVAGIEMPVGTRAQEHTAGHVGFPEVKCLADDGYINAKRFCVRGGGNAVRPCADDEKFCVFHGYEQTVNETEAGCPFVFGKISLLVGLFLLAACA